MEIAVELMLMAFGVGVLATPFFKNYISHGIYFGRLSS
jgi:hypothetical protein